MTTLSNEERKAIEKEITGLKAKLNWDHIAEAQRAVYRLRLVALQQKLQNVNISNK